MTEQTNNLPEAPTSMVIQAYSIFEYTQKIQQAINDGYYFELDTNEGTPQQFGFHYEVTMYKKLEVDYQELDKTLTADNIKEVPKELEDEINKAIGKVQPQKQRGRPTK